MMPTTSATKTLFCRSVLISSNFQLVRAHQQPQAWIIQRAAMQTMTKASTSTPSRDTPPTFGASLMLDEEHASLREKALERMMLKKDFPTPVSYAADRIEEDREEDCKLHFLEVGMPHSGYDMQTIDHIEQTHHKVGKMHEHVAFRAVQALRKGFDIVSGYRGAGGGMTKADWVNRCLFLETVAGVPGMVAGMARHLRSLRLMRGDYGWIHTLLEEAENERMHLMIFMRMKQPSFLFRSSVFGAQGVFFTLFTIAYAMSPRTCHRFVGYLEEEAVKTYTGLLQDIEDGHLKAWSQELAPKVAREYYKLPSDAKVLEVIKCIRADEANHRDVNHTFANLDQKTAINPFKAGKL